MIKLKILQSIIFVCIGLFLGIVLFDVLPYNPEKYGTLADWISGIGTVAAIYFVYWQIQEQKREFEESQVAKVSISFSRQSQLEKVGNSGGRVLGEPNYYIWAVNDGLSSGSFIFLGFCKKEDIKYIRDDDKDVIYNPHHDLLHDLQPYTCDDFQPLKPGEISKQEIISPKTLECELNNPKDIYVLYMSATGRIDKKEIKLREGE